MCANGLVPFIAVCVGLNLLTAACQAKHGLELRLPSSANVPVRAMAVTPHGSWAVIVGGDFIGLLQNPRPGYAFIVNLKRNSIERQLPKEGDGESGAVILKAGQSEKIVTSSYDGSVELSGIRADSKSIRIPLNMGAITALAATADGKNFVAAGYGGNRVPNMTKIVVCDARGRILRRYGAGSQLIRDISCSPDGRTIAVCDVGEGDVTLIDAKSGVRRILRPHRPRIWKPRNLFEDYANGVAVTKAGLLLVGGQRGDLRHHPAGWIEVWDVRKDRLVRTVRCGHAVAFITTDVGTVAAIEGNQLASKRASLRLWYLASLKPIPSAVKPPGRLSTVTLFDHGRKILSATDGGLIGMVDIKVKR